MAATTLVAAPFTFGGSQNVGAASLDEMELLAQYSFESGYTDSVSGASGTAITNTGADAVALAKDDAGNTYLQVTGSASVNNYLQVENPVESGSDFTIAMKVRTHESNDYQGLWAFMTGTTGSFYGLCGTGGVHYNNMSGAWADLIDNHGALPVDSAWHEVVSTVTADGAMTVYLDGEEAFTLSDANFSSLVYGYENFAIGTGSAENGWAWGSATADYDDVRIYSGAADAQAAAAIYDETATEALVSYDFENGIDDYNVTGTVEAVEDEVQGNVVNVGSDYTTYPKNYITFDNPFKGTDLTEATIAMNVKLTGTAVNSFEAHWGFANDAATTPLFALSGDGSLHFNGDPGYFDQSAGLMSVDDSWHKVAVVVKNDGTLNTYVDGHLANTANITNLISGAAATTITDHLNTVNSFFLGIAGTFWGSAGASYDNVAFYNTALTDLEIANLPGTAQVPGGSEDPDEPEEPMDPTQPYLLTKDAGKWQVIDGETINTTSKSLSGYITGNNFSISGWMNFNSISGNNMYLFQMQGANDTVQGLRFSTSREGNLRTWLMNSSGVDANWDSEQLLPTEETFLFTVNYDGDNHTINVYINNELYFTYTNETYVIPASSYPMGSILLGTSQWGDPTLDGRLADLYISNELMSTEDIAAKVAAADYPAWDNVSEGVIPIVPERENLNVVEGAENVTYVKDENGNNTEVIQSVSGNAKALLSTEQYLQETLSTSDVTVNAGYREFDTEGFLSNADDFSVTAWVRWYGDQSTSWGGAQTLTAQRFFDLFSIDEEEQGSYEFYFNGWEENYYDRNMSQSRSQSDIQQAIEELTQYNNFATWADSANAEAAVYLCGITAGATMNGLNRPCFRPGATYAANNNQTNSGLPYQWTHIAVVYNADGHVNSETGEVYGASLTYYVDGTAYASRYYDYADFDEAENEFYQNNSSPKGAYFIDGGETHARPDSNSQVVGGSADGADIIYGLASAEALKVKNMGLDTMYLGKSTASEAFWNGQYQNAYLYNYAITSTEVGEDYTEFVEPVQGVSSDRPGSVAENPFTLDSSIKAYSLITEEDEFSKSMELGFNAEWLNNSAFRGTDSLTLEGEGGYVDVSPEYLKDANGNVSDQLTFSTWVNVLDSVDWGRIFDIKGANGELFLSNNGWFNNDADVGMGLRSSTLSEAGKEVSHTDTSEGQYIPTGNWVNITVVIDGTDVSIYYQGNLHATGTLEMTLSEMEIDTFYLGRSAAVDGKYGLPLDADNNVTFDETYLFQTALTAEQVAGLTLSGFAGTQGSTTPEDSTRLEMVDVADLFDAQRNVNVYYVDISGHKTLSADVMNALANSTGKTLYVRVQQGVSYDFVWKLTSDAFAGKTYSSADEFDLLVSGDNMSNEDATTILTKWTQVDPTANVTLQAQTITVYADHLPVSLPLFINYGRDFLEDNNGSLSDTALNLYQGTASDYTLVTKDLPAATDLDGNALTQDYTNPSTNASGTVTQYYAQTMTEGGSYILTPNDLP